MRRAFAHPDPAIAAGLLAMGLFEALFLAETAPAWPQALLTPVWTIPLVWRRRWSVPVLAVVIVMGPLLGLVNTQGGVMSFVLAAILAAYTVGRELEAPATWWGPALTVGFGWVVFAVTGGELSDFVFVALLYGGAWAVGHVIRARAVEVDELTQEARELRRVQAKRERQAVEEERARIARELHDIVSHSLSVITIQIQAVRRRLGSLETNEVEALEAIEATARQAMDEMRRLLGVLRAQREPPALAPQPSFHQLHDLVEEARAAGLQVRLEVVGDSVALSPGISLTAYRVVQEALTNVRKHAGATRAEVSVRYLPRSLEIRVDDTGGRRSTPPRTERSHERGYGLAGMRERVTLYGGTLDAGPRPEGGFHILVSLPLAAAESVMA